MPASYAGMLACPRCGQTAAESDVSAGCNACRSAGVGVNLAPVYSVTRGPLPDRPDEPGIFRFRDLLPLAAADVAVSLGEGQTPLLRIGRLGCKFGVENLWVKDESRNPTLSFKDRLAAVAVSKAVAAGASTVVASSSGNAGAAVAAYAAAAGLRCVILTISSVPPTMKTVMQMYGATVLAVASGPDRWTLMRQAVDSLGWVALSGYTDPPIGGNAFGVDGYKTIAYELWQQLGMEPDVVVVPSGYGDSLSAIVRGFEDLRALGLADRVPRMVAVDPFGAYAANLAAPDGEGTRVPVRPSMAFSIATPVAPYQGLRALRTTAGTAVSEPSDDAIARMQQTLAATHGLYVEGAAAMPLLAVEKLRADNWITPSETVVVLATSSGLKDPAASARYLPDVPVIEPNLASLEGAMTAVCDPIRGGQPRGTEDKE